MNEGVVGVEFSGLRFDLLTIIGLFLLLVSGAVERAIAGVFSTAPPTRPPMLRLGAPRLVLMSATEAADAAQLLGTSVATLVTTEWHNS